ncbi:MAG: helix-turn-helix domain-containing protein [Bacteroidales bacterium]
MSHPHDIVLRAIIYGHFSPFYYLSGPFIYLYVRSIITDDARLKWKDIVHFIPMLLLLVGIFPYYFQDFNSKIALMRTIEDDMASVHTNVNWLFSQSFVVISRALLICGYVVASYIYFSNSEKIILENKLFNAHYYRKLKIWLYTLLGIAITMWFSYLIVMLTCTFFVTNIQSGTPAFFINAFTVGFYFIFSVSLFFIPEILYGLPKHQQLSYQQLYYNQSELPPTVVHVRPELKALSPMITMENDNNNENDADKLSPNLKLFTDEYIREIGLKVNQVVQDKDYLNPNFSKAMLSSQIVIPVHHISYYFTDILDEKFTFWRNNLRVNYAKHLLENGITTTHSIESIYEMCGFSSASSFFSVFKQHTGFSPKAYLMNIEKHQ